MKKIENLKGIFWIVIVIFFSTLLALALDALDIRETNLLMIYLIGVAIVVIEIHSRLLKIVYAIVCVLVFNFFFTEPYYTFHVNDVNNLVTMAIFLIVAFIMETLVTKIHNEAESARWNEQQAQALFDISSGYLNVSGLDEIIDYSIKSLYRIQKIKCIVYIPDQTQTLGKPYYSTDDFDDPTVIENDTLAKWCFENKTPCGFGTAYFDYSVWKYFPIMGKVQSLGVIGVYCQDTQITSEQNLFLNTVLSQMAMAVEKNQLYNEQVQNSIISETNKMRADLVDSISDHITKPLQKIQAVLSEKKNREVFEETIHMQLLADNLKIISQVSQPEYFLTLKRVSGDEVVDFVSKRFAFLLKDCSLSIEQVTVKGDRVLLGEALANLLENALRHTKDKTEICVNVRSEYGSAVFEVSDNGGGIEDSVLNELIKKESRHYENNRNIGIGLSICKNIAALHHGKLHLLNNVKGGLTASLLIPLLSDIKTKD